MSSSRVAGAAAVLSFLAAGGGLAWSLWAPGTPDSMSVRASMLDPANEPPAHLLSPAEGSGPAGAVESDAVNGMTVSCPTWGHEWGSDEMVSTMEELAGLGVNWVAIHPYARIRDNGEVSWRELEAPPDWIRRPIEEGRRLGIQVLVKPHLAYWGSSFSWRGEIEFERPEQWDRFWSGYRQWIVELARYSEGAGAYVVGTELDRTLHHEEQWRAITAEVREVYPGPLTYAANWPDWQRVPFWDELDAVGIQAYFPLLEGQQQGADGGVPSEAQLEAGWERVMEPLRAHHARTGQPVVFTELGYNRSARAAHEPWAYEMGGPNAEEIQQRCLRVALRVVAEEPVVLGSFLWKWFPGRRQPRDFRMADPALQGIIRDQWAGLEQ